MLKDLKNNITTVLLKEPADDAGTDAYSNILDVSDYNGVEIDAIIGALTGTLGSSNYLTPILQESNTTAAADFTSVSAADVLGGFTVIDSASEDSVIQRVGYIGTKRYLRVKFDYTGTITAGITGAVGILGLPKEAPTSAVAAVSST